MSIAQHSIIIFDIYIYFVTSVFLKTRSFDKSVNWKSYCPIGYKVGHAITFCCYINWAIIQNLKKGKNSSKGVEYKKFHLQVNDLKTHKKKRIIIIHAAGKFLTSLRMFNKRSDISCYIF